MIRVYHMKTICVTAAFSKLGKTTLVEKLLHKLPGWAACKVTACIPHEDGKCPRGHEDTCGVCSSLKEPFVIEEEETVIRMPNTDTGRYADAGAAKVFWIKAREEAMPEALRGVAGKCGGFPGVIFEGNHALAHLEPNLSVMILSKNGKFKDSASAVKDKVMLFTMPGEYDEAAEELLARL